MLRDALVVAARYHAWANDRILTLAAGIPDEELRTPGAFDHGTAFDTDHGRSPGDLDLLDALELP